MTEQEYEEWKRDPQAQAEYQQWRFQDELKQLPDQLKKSFNQSSGNQNEFLRRSTQVNLQASTTRNAHRTFVPNH